MYMSLKASTETKLIRTFLKLCKVDFQYNTIKGRISNVIKHNSNCKRTKK